MKQYRNLIKPYLVWAFVVIVIPLILIALYAFTEDGNEDVLLYPGEFPQIPGSYVYERYFQVL